MKLFSKSQLKYFLFLALALGLFSFLPHSASATTYYWVGADGATFNSASNWRTTDPTDCSGGGAGIPGASDQAFFDADCDNGITIGSAWSVSDFYPNAGYSGVINASAAGTLTVNNGLLLYGGTFTAPAGNLFARFIKYGAYATFNHNGGTVTINGYSSSIPITFNLDADITFNNLTFGKVSGDFYDISTGRIVNVLGDLIFNDGAWRTTGGVGQIVSYGNVTVGAGWDGSPDYCTLNMNSTTTQTFTTASSRAFGCNLYVNKGSATLNLAGTAASVRVFSLMSGNFVTNGLGFTTTREYTQDTGTFTGSTGTVTIGISFLLTNGTFTAPSGTMTVGTTFTQNGGTFTAPSGTLTFTGTFNVAGGTFNHNNGTVVCNATGGGYIYNGNFYNFTINSANSSAVGIGINTVTTVNGTMNFTQGVINGNTTYGTGVILAKGNVVIGSSWGGSTQSTNTTLKMSSSSPQTITIGSQPFNNNLTIDSSSTVTLAGSTLTVQNFTMTAGTFSGGAVGLTVVGTFTQNGGTFTAPSGTLTLKGSLTKYSGTFNHNNGTVVYACTAGCDTSVGGTIDFNNFTIANSTNVVTGVYTSTTINVAGLTNFSSGRFDGYSTAKLGTVKAMGNVTIGSGWNGYYNSPGTTLLMSSSSPQTITVSSAPFNNNLAINSSSTVTLAGSTLMVNNFTMTAGTFNGNAVGLTVYNDFVISAGTFNAPSGTLTTSSSYLYGTAYNSVKYFTVSSGATFNPNGGTVVIGGGVNGSTNHNVVLTAPTAVNLHFNNLTVSKDGEGLYIAAGSTVNVDGLLNFNDGKFTTGGTYTGSLIALGNVIIGAAWDGTADTTTFATLNMASTTGNQTITASSAAFNSNLTINSSSTVTLAGSTLTAKAISVTAGTFDLVAVPLTATTLTVSSGATLRLNGGQATTITTTNLNTGSTVEYSGTSTPYTLKNWSYKNLVINGGATSVFALGAALTTVSTTTLSSGILSLAGYNFSTINLINNSTLRLIGTEILSLGTTTGSGYVEYVGDGDSVADIYNLSSTPYYNLKINSTDTADVFNAGLFPTFIKQNNTTPAASNGISYNGTIPLGGSGTGDAYSLYPRSVIKEDSIYKMWYTGYDGSQVGRVFYATSSDGLTWNKYDNSIPASSNTSSTNGRIPLGTSGRGDSNMVYGPTVIKDGSTYKMWYAGFNGTNWQVFYATSPDGLTWTKYDNTTPSASDTTSTNGRVPRGTAGKGDVTHVLAPMVIKDGSTYKMWYVGLGTADGSYRIYYATSPDGLTWTKYNNTAPSASDTTSTDGRIPIGTTGRGDSAHSYAATVIKDGSTYKMWYAGFCNTGGCTGGWRIFYATSPDGLTWTKYDNSIPSASDTTSTNGRIPWGTTGKGDSTGTFMTALIKEGSIYRMWYAGQDPATPYPMRTYYASSNDGTDVNNNLSVARGTYNASTTLNIGGSLLHTGGTINATTTNLILTGTDQTVSVVATTTIATLTKSVTTPATLTFGTTSPIIITATTTLNGTLGNMLKLRSVAPGTQWRFDPQATTTGRVFSYIDVQDSYNIGTTTISTAGITGYVDSLRNTGWGISSGPLTIGRSGQQIATTTISTSPAAKDMGGAFTFTRSVGTGEVTQIVLKQAGSLPASYLSNLQLWYKASTNCATTKPSDAVQFGTGSVDFTNNYATTTGSLTVGTDQVCVYVTYTLTGASTESLLGYSIDFQIFNPSTDVTDTITPAQTSPVNIMGATIIIDESITTSLLSLQMLDSTKNPTVYYLKDHGVWKKEGLDGTPYRMTNPNIVVQSLTFTNLTSPTGTDTVRMEMVTSNVEANAPDSFLNVTRTYRTTGTLRVGR